VCGVVTEHEAADKPVPAEPYVAVGVTTSDVPKKSPVMTTDVPPDVIIVPIPAPVNWPLTASVGDAYEVVATDAVDDWPSTVTIQRCDAPTPTTEAHVIFTWSSVTVQLDCTYPVPSPPYVAFGLPSDARPKFVPLTSTTVPPRVSIVVMPVPPSPVIVGTP
jgi:hypothetical protein